MYNSWLNDRKSVAESWDKVFSVIESQDAPFSKVCPLVAFLRASKLWLMTGRFVWFSFLTGRRIQTINWI
jgi:2-oxoglutarate dehydrogenase complex dehydrogenase (E1) component-like enzyme